jgi:origin recognition complex subunit 6
VESVYRALQSAVQRAERDGGTPSKRRRSNGGDVEVVASDGIAVPTDEQIPALAAAVYLMTAQAMRGQSGAAASKLQQRKVQTAVAAFFTTQDAPTVIIQPDQLQEDTETYTQAATSQGWTDMEWYKNLSSPNETNTAPAAGHDEDNGPATPRRQPAKTPLRRKEKHSQRKIGEEEENPAGLLPGLGTMFQPAVDWLSEERRAEFDAWKEDLLESVAVVEQRA